MKKKIIFTLILFCISLSAFSQSFNLTVPAGWIKNEQSVALAQYQKGTGSFIITADTVPSSANTPDKYIEFIKAKLKNTFKDIAFEIVVNAKKDSYETRELKYTVSMSGMKIKYDVLYIFVNEKTYTLTSGNLEGSIDSTYNSEIKTFFTSFKLK